jgi:hypothetical protein
MALKASGDISLRKIGIYARLEWIFAVLDKVGETYSSCNALYSSLDEKCTNTKSTEGIRNDPKRDKSL